MHLFEAIIEANHQAISGDKSAGVRVVDFADALPVVALTCIDVRLNPLLPAVLGLPPEEFIWLRNAGNVITSTTSSTMRSLALACAIKGGKEIVILGHTDCRVGQTTVMQLTDSFKALGIERSRLPENLTEFFGVFASERQNVLKAVEFVRVSPLIGPKVPVHGLLVDIQTGRLEWLVNGYQTLAAAQAHLAASIKVGAPALGSAFASAELGDFKLGEMKSPEGKIGEIAAPVSGWLKEVKVTEPAHEEPAARPKAVRAEKGRPAPVPVPPPLLLRPRPGPRKKAWWE
jgi:carbonic anhydrase